MQGRGMDSASPATGGRLIVIPALNEAQTLGAVIARVREFCPGFDCLVVNDGSTDRTAAIAREQGARVITMPFNSGIGCATKAGLLYAERNGYNFAVILDADGQHDPASVRDLVCPIVAGEADVVLGSRYGQSDGQLHVPWLRRIGHAYLMAIVALLTGRRLRDPMSGFRAVSRRAMWFYTSDHFPDDFPDANVILMQHRAGIRLIEVPAIFHERTAGVSQHRGVLRPFLYLIRATLAVLMVLLRPKPRKESGP